MLSTGIHLGWAGPAIHVLTHDENAPIKLQEDEKAFLASCSLIGAFVGATNAYLLANYWSQNKCLILAAIPHGTAFLIFAVWPNIYAFYFARFIAGWGDAIAIGVGTMYAVEIASLKIRGAVGVLMMLALSVGIFAVYSLVPYISFEMVHLIFLIFPIVQFTLCLFIPESPYLLLKKGDKLGAKNVLIRLRKTDNIEKEFVEMCNYVKEQYMEPVVFSRLVTDRACRKALMYTSGVVISQQLTGTSPFQSFSQDIFDAGDSIDPNICGIIYSFVGIVCPFICGFIVDRLGRKFLFILSGFIMSIVLTVLGGFYYLIDIKSPIVDNLATLPLISMLVYSVGYGLGLGSLPLLYMSELFPKNIRALGTCLMTLVGNGAAILTTMTFGPLQKNFGDFAPMWVFATLTVINCILMLIFLPETKGKTFDEIQKMLRNEDCGDERKAEDGHF